jgi:iron complex outermembrane recepter protein
VRAQIIRSGPVDPQAPLEALMIRLPLAASASAFALLAGASALAQPATSGGSAVGEVVVTAQRRAENLQTVPLAVSAFDKEQMERRQVSRTLDVVSFVPNMEGHNNTGLGTANTYSLRALNNTESIATFDPPVGTYVDDIYVSRQGANNFSFFDVERVEVLRGPQGTLFGRNTTGGAVQIIMRKPSPTFGGFAEAGFGNHDRRTARGSVDVPLSDMFLTKFSAFYTKDDGYVTNQISGEKMNFEDSYGLRGALRVNLSDSTVWDVSAEWIDAQSTNLINFRAPGSDKRINFTRLSLNRPLGTIASAELQDNVPNNRAKTGSVTSNLQLDVTDEMTINIISGYRKLKQEFVTDAFDSLNSGAVTFDSGYHILTNPPGTTTPGAQDSTHEQFSQEIKFNGTVAERIDYVGGFYYITERNRTVLGNLNVAVSGAATVSQDRTIRNDTEAYAGYLQLDFHVTDRLTATVGARYTDETKDISFTPNPNPLPRASPAFQPFSNTQLIAAGIPTTQTERILTPRFALDFEVNEDLMVFASATRGFKSGGWNARANIGSQALDFAPEKIWSYETGLRSDWLDGRLRVNLTGFYYRVTDYQLPAGFLDPSTNTIVFITRNFADLVNYGLESEILFVPVEGLNIFWSAGVQHARYKNLDAAVLAQQARCLAGTPGNCNTGIVTPTGAIAKPTRAPSFSSVLGVNYEFPLTSDWELVPSVNWSRIKGHFIGTSNPPLSFQRTRDTFNAGLTLRNEVSGWSLTADCTNCTNKTYVVSFLIYPYLNEPVRWNVRLRKEF